MINNTGASTSLTENLLQKAASRQGGYSFFAEIFLQEPTLSLWPKQYLALNELLDDPKEPSELSSRHAPVIPEGLTTTVTRIQQEYYDCFFVPMSTHFVPPFESALRTYTPGKRKPFRSLNSPEGNHVAQCYAALGFDPWKLNLFAPLREMHIPDHLGFELAFLAALCSSELRAWENGQLDEVQQWQDLQKQFLEQHLKQGISQFAVALQEHAPGYYAQAACAAQQWVNLDFQDLAEGVLITEERRINHG